MPRRIAGAQFHAVTPSEKRAAHRFHFESGRRRAPAGVSVMVFDNLRTSRPFALPRLCRRTLPAVLGRTESRADRALNLRWESSDVLESRSNLEERLFTRNKLSCHYLSHFWDDRQAQSHLLESTQRSNLASVLSTAAARKGAPWTQMNIC